MPCFHRCINIQHEEGPPTKVLSVLGKWRLTIYSTVYLGHWVYSSNHVSLKLGIIKTEQFGSSSICYSKPPWITPPKWHSPGAWISLLGLWTWCISTRGSTTRSVWCGGHEFIGSCFQTIYLWTCELWLRGLRRSEFFLVCFQRFFRLCVCVCVFFVVAASKNWALWTKVGKKSKLWKSYLFGSSGVLISLIFRTILMLIVLCCVLWVLPPPSNSGKWRFSSGSPTKNVNPFADCHWDGGQLRSKCGNDGSWQLRIGTGRTSDKDLVRLQTRLGIRIFQKLCWTWLLHDVTMWLQKGDYIIIYWIIL